MWVTKLLISPVKIRIFCPKKSKFGPKMAFLFFLGQALPAHLVGGCGARAVSRKTPIYFILGVVEYQFYRTFPAKSRTLTLEAMAYITSKVPCIKFLPKVESSPSFVTISDRGDSCSSALGRVGGEQELNLSR